mmetsp:Transcript_5066/g.15191  ORF Transcript_5066/g.15191 Transcript_5066/m.15191 type:complete len:212 (+) Transcript_5066:1565-2200(+)
MPSSLLPFRPDPDECADQAEARQEPGVAQTALAVPDVVQRHQEVRQVLHRAEAHVLPRFSVEDEEEGVRHVTQELRNSSRPLDALDRVGLLQDLRLHQELQLVQKVVQPLAAVVHQRQNQERPPAEEVVLLHEFPEPVSLSNLAPCRVLCPLPLPLPKLHELVHVAKELAKPEGLPRQGQGALQVLELPSSAPAAAGTTALTPVAQLHAEG